MNSFTNLMSSFGGHRDRHTRRLERFDRRLEAGRVIDMGQAACFVHSIKDFSGLG